MSELFSSTTLMPTTSSIHVAAATLAAIGILPLTTGILGIEQDWTLVIQADEVKWVIIPAYDAAN